MMMLLLLLLFLSSSLELKLFHTLVVLSQQVLLIVCAHNGSCVSHVLTAAELI